MHVIAIFCKNKECSASSVKAMVPRWSDVKNFPIKGTTVSRTITLKKIYEGPEGSFAMYYSRCIICGSYYHMRLIKKWKTTFDILRERLMDIDMALDSACRRNCCEAELKGLKDIRARIVKQIENRYGVKKCES